MGSLGRSEAAARIKAMWVSPKLTGANPSERWGHSAVYFNGNLYIFGGCRGGVHFSDVLVWNLPAKTWSVLRTSGPGPGPRDSHSAALVGHRMLVFGGTNGSRKVNDLHILDLRSGEWARPECRGTPPPARESHTATVVGDDRLVVFGGSGEGEANYLNDLHVLDLKTMEWSSPPARGGSAPAPRDSHSAVAVGTKLFVFGGDSGDRYQGDISVLDVNSLVWSRVATRGPSPGARAGHAAVSIGTKMYVLGGVGDKHYYNDIWVLDMLTSSWARLEMTSQQLQGRFSHTATVTNLGITIFGGCGEDERPLNELLVLQIDSLQKAAFVVAENEDATSLEVEEIECIPEKSQRSISGMLHPKRRRTSNSKFPEPEEHSHSPSQQSSPSQSDHNPAPTKKAINGPYPSSRVHPMFRQKILLAKDVSLPENLVGAEVRGQVDGAFDSGYLMTATVNGKVFRGVLFAPVVKGGVDGQHTVSSGLTYSNHAAAHPKNFQQCISPSEQGQSRRLSPKNRGAFGYGKESRASGDLQGLVLTLASPGSDLGHGR